MERLEYENWLDEALTEAIGSKDQKPDFEKWKQEHPGTVKMLKELAGQEEPERIYRFKIRRIIMKSRIIQLVAAAVIIIAISFGIKLIGGPDVANTAWGNVISRVTKVHYVHFLFVADPQHHRSMHPFEGWYSHGKMVRCSWQGEMQYDNGQKSQYFDRHKIGGDKSPSILKEQTFFSWISKGLLAENNEQFTKQTPTNVGEDFLIYKFDPPEGDRNWIKSIFITVGKNSLLPIQLKTYHKYDYETGEGIDDIKDGYTLLIFDYEA